MNPPAPTKPAKKDLVKRLGKVRLLSLDVDGVLTDGGIYYAEDGTRMHRFNVLDGVGIKRVQAAGVEVAIITAGASEAVRHRAQYLGVRYVFIGIEDKLATLNDLCAGLGFGLDRVAHVGDDLNDLPVLEAVGLPLTVPGGVAEVRRRALYITKTEGGAGAVREICDLIVAGRA
ncbi:MAG: HAD hydrolase family protein [Rhodospirillales bacterium]|jgi:3-deoxy-D-manno-octulosonate 8-phosphate phosphatase (KDO 8-P phosphatase)|nr:HAD hydrolase family protein [Rhodospirillales bacterium]MDP6774804.1 HAD hydrolase family protein [Rhodospirillales bacterium]